MDNPVQVAEESSLNFQCNLCDTEVVHSMAQLLLHGLATASVDSTTGDIFKSPSSIAVGMKTELAGNLPQRSETLVRKCVDGDGDHSDQLIKASTRPTEFLSDLIDDFVASKRNMLSHVSGFFSSESRLNKIKDFMQKMEMENFWALDERKATAKTILKNIDMKCIFHCPERFDTSDELAEHRSKCKFRIVDCTNDALNVPKPLFPLAGQPMVHHHISACRRIPNLAQIYLVGFYEEREFALYVSSISNELRIPVRYLREDKPRGSAGGLYSFRDYIMEDSPSHIVLLNCDVCSSFPLPDMLEAHKKYGGMGTLLVNKVSAESANQFGELVADPETNELLHYTEKPETFVSDLINCGVYIFTPNILNAIEDVLKQKKDRANLRRVSSFEALQSATKALPADYVRLDQDILSPLAGKKKLYTYQTLDFWEQIKTPGMSLRCSGLYLSQFRHTSPHLLASGDGKKSATIIGDVYIHPSAKVHSTAKIGPNVSISANARIGAGARLISCIILDDVEIMENAVVIHSIVGWKSTIGKWSRVQGEGDHKAKLGITILGEAVDVEDEVVVTNSIVLPNKTLNVSVQDEIIL